VQCTLTGTDVTLGQFQTRTGAQNVRQGVRQRWRKSLGMYLLQKHPEIELQALIMSGPCTQKGGECSKR
jgi:hypothetical protein